MTSQITAYHSPAAVPKVKLRKSVALRSDLR